MAGGGSGKDLITGVTCEKPYVWADGTAENWKFNTEGVSEKFNVGTPRYRHIGRMRSRILKPPSPPPFPLQVVAYDYGCKTNILRRLASYGCKITVVPSTHPAEEVLALNPDGILFRCQPTEGRMHSVSHQNRSGWGVLPTFHVFERGAG